MSDNILKILHSGKDNFVGIRFEKSMPRIYFPIGYNIENHDINLSNKEEREKVKIVRKDILLMLRTLNKYMNKNSEEENEIKEGLEQTKSFPFFNLYELLRDFLEDGYYQERESIYKIGNSGKINWSRTIKRQRPIMQGDSFIYTKFIINKNEVNSNSIIRLIHEYCVYESNLLIGFLFGNIELNHPKIEYNKELFLGVLKSKLTEIFDDKKRKIILNMIKIVMWLGDEDSNYTINEFGTYNYQTIWEKMIDVMFKERDKNEFYPTGKLYINYIKAPTTNLRIDSIYINKEKIYIVDAKYYKYGISNRPNESLTNNDSYNLPRFSDINKQISYAEYVEYKYNQNRKIFFPLEEKEGVKISERIKNLFILPYDKEHNEFATSDIVHYIGYGVSDWKDEIIGEEKGYNKVHIFLFDTKTLIECCDSVSDERIDDEIRKLELVVGQYEKKVESMLNIL